MARRAKKKLKSKLSLSTGELLSKAEVDSENIVRLKLTTRKGTRIESVALNKLEEIANKTKLHWKLEDGWLTLYGL
jgi:hypothetical protein